VFKQSPALFRRQPVSKPDTKASHTFDTPNACGELGTQQTSISSLVRDTADGSEPQIDGRGSVLELLKVDSIAENHSAVERESRL
jgi:hypothetical protein